LTNASLYIGNETTQIYSVNNNKKSARRREPIVRLMTLRGI